MNRNKFLIPVLLVLFSASVFSCKKESNDDGYITESKTVLDYFSGRPVPGIKIYIGIAGLRLIPTTEPWNFLGAYTSLIPARALNIVDSVVTDLNGKFSYRYTQTFDPTENVYMRSGGPILPVEYSVILPPRSIGNGDSQSDTIYTDQTAILNLIINKSNPAIISDTLYENIDLIPRPGTLQRRGSLLKAQVGMTSAVVKQFFPKNCYDSAIISWRLYNHGLQSFGEDTIVLSPAGVNNFNISY